MNCPRCGSARTKSQGKNLSCRDCSRIFPKIPRRPRVPTEDRPPCPSCGGHNPYACGLPGGVRSWCCRLCGRCYKETPIRDKVELPIMEVQVE
mgnify:CR=1 FL=1